MGFSEMFKEEDTLEVKFSEFYKLIKQASQYEIVMNGINCNVPHRYMREMAYGISEESIKELEE